MFVVEGIYDGETITLAKPVPVKGKTAVSVQFPIDIDNQDLTGFDRPQNSKNDDAIREAINKAKALEGVLPPSAAEDEIKKRMAALKSLAGIASAYPMSLDEIKDARLARQ